MAAVSHEWGANLRASESYPTHGILRDSAYLPADGLSTFCPSTSAPAETRLCAARFSFAGSNHEFVQISRTLTPGCVACAPSANALACRITSGIAYGTT